MAVFQKKAIQKVLSAKATEKKHTLLIVDDEHTIVQELTERLSQTYRVLTAFDGREALALVRDRARVEDIKVIIADQRMPNLSGVDFLEQTLTLLPRAKRIILTAYSDIDAVIKAINRAQVFRFITKPWDPAKMLETIELALEVYASEETGGLNDSQEIVGNHPKLRACLDMVRQVADTDAPILVHGETGTGKELIARALFQNSSRRNMPFVTLHCGALPESMLEAELFGHKKGSFTGAHADRPGRIARAHRGTLFLDEVGEIPLQTQAKLLRFFQFGEIQRVGSDQPERVETRIITATHRDLPAMVEQGKFREDFYYRIKVVEIELPPLRERRSDIPLLARAILKRYWKKQGEPILDKETLMILEDYAFPGNVRELAHIIERACLLARTNQIGPDLLSSEVLDSWGRNRPNSNEKTEEVAFESLSNEVLKEARQQACKQASDAIERVFVERLMAMHEDVSSAARASGMARTYLHRLIAKHNLGLSPAKSEQ